MYEVDPIVIFAIILTISLIIPELLKEMQIITVPFYIIGGIVLGPHILGFEAHAALEFIGDIGILFLVFIAGLDIGEFGATEWKTPIELSIISAGTCFLAGFVVGQMWGYALKTSLLLGTILMSSSVGEIVPIVTSSAHLREKFSEYLLPAIIIMDATSLFFLALLIQGDSSSLNFMIFLVETLLLVLLIVLFLPRLSRWFFGRKIVKPRETDLKFIIAILVISVALGELINLHGILIAFLVGAVLGRHIPNEKTRNKLHGFGYGFFIPIFFVVLGMNLDISVLYKNVSGVLLIFVIILTLVTSKVLGAMLFSYLKGMKKKEGFVLGVTLWPQLSATLAATAVGFEYGIFDDAILTAIVFMAIITALGAPFCVHALIRSEGTKHEMKEHVVIIGYGRTSARLAYLLDMDEKDFVVIDQKLSRVRLLKNQGIEAILGKGEDLNILEKANIKDARVAIITIPDDHEVYLCAKHIKESNPNCHIIARVHSWETYERLKTEGLIDFAVWPEKLSSEIIIKYIIDSDLWDKEKNIQSTPSTASPQRQKEA